MGGCSVAARNRNWEKKNRSPKNVIPFDKEHFKAAITAIREKGEAISINKIIKLVQKYEPFSKVDVSLLKTNINNHLLILKNKNASPPKFSSLMGELHNYTLNFIDNMKICDYYARVLSKIIYYYGTV